MLRKCRIIAILSLLVSSAAFAQNQQTTSQAIPITTSQITLPVYTLNPAPASGASIGIVANPGKQTIYYWISANYPVGSATLAGPFVITQAPGTLSSSHYVTINPTLPGGVTSYDVLKTSSPIQPSGACACAVATGVSPGTVTNDQSNSTSAYTVAPVNTGLLVLTLANEVQSAGVSHLILRQNGVFVADLSTGGGGVVTGSGTDGIYAVWTGTHSLGNGSLVQNGSTLQFGTSSQTSFPSVVFYAPSTVAMAATDTRTCLGNPCAGLLNETSYTGSVGLGSVPLVGNDVAVDHAGGSSSSTTAVTGTSISVENNGGAVTTLAGATIET